MRLKPFIFLGTFLMNPENLFIYKLSGDLVKKPQARRAKCLPLGAHWQGLIYL
jgi:hypothetical protein